MKDLPLNLLYYKNKISTTSSWLLLLELTLNDPSSTKFYLVNNTENVTYDGQVYTAFNFTLETMKTNSTGRIPTPVLRVCGITQILQEYLFDLNGGVGSAVKLTIVNSECLAEDYSELELNFSVTGVETDNKWVAFTLGSTNSYRKTFPTYRHLGLHCRWHYNLPNDDVVECGYVGETVEGITLPSGSPVSINVTGHPFSTDDILTFINVDGTTELNGNSYTITKTDADNFTLNSTDGDDFTAWGTTSGTVGYSTCDKTLKSCRERDNSANFGGFPGMRSKSVRLV